MTPFRKNRRRSRSAFTLIDVLVVGCVASILLTLTGPALLQSRSLARDAECTNRLKMIGLGLHNYHDVYNTFAPGWVSRDWNGQGHPSTGWMASLLPYVDQANLFNQLNFQGCIYEPSSATPAARAELQRLLTLKLDVYRCVAEPDVDVNSLRGGFGLASFSGNYGSMPIARWSDLDGFPGQASAHRPQESGRAERFRRGQPTGFDGIFSVNSRVGLRDIIDGTSNTFLAGERSVLGKGGLWPGPRSNYHESDVVSDASFASGLNLSETGYSSRHPGGIHFLFGDGAVQFLNSEIDSRPEGGTLQFLAGRNDGNVIGAF